MIASRKNRTGQALVMLTVTFVAMSGLIGLAVDLGWSYYVRRSAQAAADAAALAAVNRAWDAIQSGTSFDCLGLSCISTPTECGEGLSGNAESACQYAQQNGFSSGGDSGRQSVKVSAGANLPPAPPPTVPGVSVYYWVTVRVSNTIPQLYSAILGNANATVSARATAAIVNADVRASLIALNRQNDAGPNGGPTDIKLGNQVKVEAANGMFLSSTDSKSGWCAGCISVTADGTKPIYTLIRSSGSGQGSVFGATGGSWPYQNQGEGAPFWDPMRNLGQPPLTSTSLNPIPVQGGNINTTTVPQCATACPPGAYYNSDIKGGPLTINSNVNFGGSTFGNYVFYGGLTIGGATVDFGPGEYVFAGVLPNSGAYNLNITDGAGGAATTVTGGTGGADAGRVFILTNSNYPGLSSVAPVPGLPTLSFGQGQITGNKATVTLTGLDPNQEPTDSGNTIGYHLSDFGPLVFWQDQNFSTVKYTSNGYVDTSSDCGGSSLDSPCTQSPPTVPNFLFGSEQPTTLNGTYYQPRGAWTTITSGTLTVMQMISGAFNIQDFGAGIGILNLPPLPNAMTRRAVALIE